MFSMMLLESVESCKSRLIDVPYVWAERVDLDKKCTVKFIICFEDFYNKWQYCCPRAVITIVFNVLIVSKIEQHNITRICLLHDYMDT